VTAPEHDSPPSSPEGARLFLESQVDAALEPYRGKLPDAELAWVRERLLESAADEDGLAALLRAAFPRDVERSGEVFYSVKPTR
jgi:hypothetical protein